MRSTALDFSFSPSPSAAAHHPSRLSFFPSSPWFSCVAAEARGREAAHLSSSPHSPGTRRRGKGGRCEASPGLDLFPAACPDVLVREARLEDCWEVAETHCSSFFPDYKFPMDLALRVDRFVALLAGFSLPAGCMRSCLVAVAARRTGDGRFTGGEGLLEGILGFNRGTVAGILTVDTAAEYLPRRGPLRLRRSAIAYISNVAVRDAQRRRGIGKQLVAEAEAVARGWGCRAIALHCDAANAAAVRLYRGQGYRSIRIPEHANWPQPRTGPDTVFYLMMKLL